MLTGFHLSVLSVGSCIVLLRFLNVVASCRSMRCLAALGYVLWRQGTRLTVVIQSNFDCPVGSRAFRVELGCCWR